jgi:hypothetical protein
MASRSRRRALQGSIICGTHRSVYLFWLPTSKTLKFLAAESEPNRQVCILTSGTIIYAWVHKLRLYWDAPFSDIGIVSLDENGIRVLDRKKREIGFIIITERHDREWFYGQISKYVSCLTLIFPDTNSMQDYRCAQCCQTP